MKKKEEKKIQMPQPTKEEYKELVLLAQIAPVPLNQHQRIMAIINKFIRYHKIT